MNGYPSSRIITVPSEWEDAMDAILKTGGVVMVIGDTDCGKTTFCMSLVNRALASKLKVAVVDSDVGQSEIGPPACVGLGYPTDQIRSLGEIVAADKAFVGTTNPAMRIPELLVATERMVRKGLGHGEDILLLDTTGFVKGPIARRLKRLKMDLVQPRNIVIFQRNDECEAMISPFLHNRHMQLHRLFPSSDANAKPASLRVERRKAKWIKAFENSHVIEMEWERCPFREVWLGAAKPYPPLELRQLSETIRAQVYHAEEQAGTLHVIVDRIPLEERTREGMERSYPNLRFSYVCAETLRRLLVGVHDVEGKLLGLGLIQYVSFRKRLIGVLTQVPTPSAVGSLFFGAIRVHPDGNEIEMVPRL